MRVKWFFLQGEQYQIIHCPKPIRSYFPVPDAARWLPYIHTYIHIYVVSPTLQVKNLGRLAMKIVTTSGNDGSSKPKLEIT